jgi:UDP-N-acetylmuramoyl-tripeptide--D-alanyl-D-alanine ligase
MTRDVVYLLAGAGGFALAAAVFAFVYYRGLALLQFYQQEEYNTDRFLAWLVRRRAFDKRATLIVLIGCVAWLALARLNPVMFNLGFYAVLFGALAYGAASSARVWTRAKKPLVMTPRANRIFYAYMVLVAFYFAGALPREADLYRDVPLLAAAFLAFFQAPPLFIVASNFLLRPLEERINRRYVREAADKLAKFAPTVIAITGSYGKTTTKHILAHTLAATAPTLATPASVNTELGITRVVREELKIHHKYFVVEMGAYGPGSIANLCALAPPSLGIITAVGLAHFERFKTLERVFQAKFELAEDVKTRGGTTLVNAGAVPEGLLRNYLAANPGVTLCGPKDGPFPAAFELVSAVQGPEGLKVRLMLRGRALEATVPLYGEHNGTNVLLAAAAAVKLGISLEHIRAALTTVPQIPHRLEVLEHPQGPTVIDDAYNSNPKGFESALKVMSAIVKKGGRRILLTPGMVELGPAHDAEHARLGRLAADHTDVALVVGPARMTAFTGAYRAAKGAEAPLLTFATQKGAEAWARRNAGPADVILFENNLPDLYETVVEF